MILDRETAAQNAEARTRNIPDTCQIVTRGYYGAPSVGDVDGDGAADAEDGWKAEPVAGRHPGDRTPPRGVPVSWGGGSNDNGHRAISLGNGMIRSTDTPTRGVTSTVPLNWVEDHWGLTYFGWSETISRNRIPVVHEKPEKTRVTEGRRWLEAALDVAVKNGKRKRAAALRESLAALPDA